MIDSGDDGAVVVCGDGRTDKDKAGYPLSIQIHPQLNYVDDDDKNNNYMLSLFLLLCLPGTARRQSTVFDVMITSHKIHTRCFRLHGMEKDNVSVPIMRLVAC